MAEGQPRSPKEISAQIAATVGEKVTNPLARTNNSLPVIGTERGSGREVNITDPNPDRRPRQSGFDVTGPEPIQIGIPESMIKPAPERRAELIAAALAPSERIVDPETGQNFNVTRMNWDNFGPDKPVTVYLNFLGNENDERESRLRLEAIALQNPDMAFVAIDHPGHGGTDKLTRAQKSTKKTDSYYAIADGMLRVAHEMGINEDNKLNLSGESLGAFGALALAVRAREHGYDVGKLLLYELPGVQDTSTVRLMLNQQGEFGKLDIAHGLPHDPELQRATFLDLPPKEKGKEDRKVQMRVVKNMHPIRYARMMSQDTAYDRLSLALSTQPDMEVVFINGSESTISPLPKVNELADRLRSDLDPNGTYPEARRRVGQNIYSGEGHFAIANPDRLGSNMRLLLTPLAEPKNPAPQAA